MERKLVPAIGLEQDAMRCLHVGETKLVAGGVDTVDARDVDCRAGDDERNPGRGLECVDEGLTAPFVPGIGERSDEAAGCGINYQRR